MFEIKINEYNLNDYKDIDIIEVAGLEPASSTITTKKSGYDGTTFNGSTLNERNIIIKGIIRNNVKTNRRELYKIFKSNIELDIKVDGYNIIGYVENVEMNNFQVITSFQVSILCPDPYFYSNLNEFRVTKTKKTFESDGEGDWDIVVNFTSSASEFTFLLNSRTYRVVHNFSSGDNLTINCKTRKVYCNNKNIYSSKNWVSWEGIEDGENSCSYSCDGSCSVNLNYKNKFNGI